MVVHCENATEDDYWFVESDASPVLCRNYPETRTDGTPAGQMANG